MGNMINLDSFAGGALQEKFNIAFKEVLENIADPNTPHKTKRKLSVELTFITDEDRELSVVVIETKTKLAQSMGVATKIIIDRDGKGGIIASEYGKQVKGQTYIRVNEETGEIIEPSNHEVDMKGIKLVK
ncbi:MAG: hypothetical protein RBR71_03630 [Gudongella sp.]|nr:hypothetical protein [Gudongella sp.]